MVYIKKENNLYILLKPWINDSCNFIYSVALTGIQLNSQYITTGDLFVAIQGCQTDGRLYIEEAIEKGASAVLSEFRDHDIRSIFNKDAYNFKNMLIPLICIRNLNQNLSAIAARFYNHPSNSLNVVGVTGTNGKTTITYLLARWVEVLGEKSAVMGTLGNGMLDNIKPSCNTTCSAIDVQKILAQLVKDKIKFVAMEVSSHGLDQYRVDSLYFKVAVFTNLSHDHLDYHGNMMQYMMSKWRLFNELYVEKYVINIDDRVGYQWLSYLPDAVAVTTKIRNLPSSWKGRWIVAVKIDYHLCGTDVFFNSSWGQGVIHSRLLGDFNVSNLLLALGALLILGYPLSLLLNTSSKLLPIPGRMQILNFQKSNRPMVVVDYAHTPDALKKVLIVLKRYCYGRLWCVFGCGGNRDYDKRALMGAIAAKYSDYIIVTDDNPRFENPQMIIDDIIFGMPNIRDSVEIIRDRAQAIRTAIIKSCSQDIVLIAGKGHERYQIIKDNHVYHSDQDIANGLLGDGI